MNEFVYQYCIKNDVDKVIELVNDPLFDPSGDSNKMLDYAVSNDSVDVVDVLLSDSRVRNLVDLVNVFNNAILNNNVKVVKLLNEKYNVSLRSITYSNFVNMTTTLFSEELIKIFIEDSYIFSIFTRTDLYLMHPRITKIFMEKFNVNNVEELKTIINFMYKTNEL